MNSVGWFEGCAFVSVDFDVEDVIVVEYADKVNQFSRDFHIRARTAIRKSA